MGSGCTANRVQDNSNNVPDSVGPKPKHPTPDPSINTVQDLDTSTEPLRASDIWSAIEEDKNTRLKRILSQVEIGHNDFFNSKGQSFLHVAAMVGNTQAISIILDSNIPTMTPDILNANLATPLHSAIIHDQIESVKTLISYGADANIEDEHGQVPVLLCSIHSRIKILEALIEANDSGKFTEALNVNGKDRKGLCAVNCSAIKGELDLCKILLEKAKANVDEPSRKGCTALLYSARGGYDQIVELLLQFGANKNHQDASGATALHHACEKNFPAVVEKLLKAGADPNVQDIIGRTPIFEAVNNNSVKSLNILLEGSTDVNAIDGLGHTALFYAVQSNNEELTSILIEKGGADVNIYSMPNQKIEKELAEQDRSFAFECARTPIHAATAISNPKLVAYLISKGAKVTEPGKGNNTALHICGYTGDIETAKELIKAGIDVVGNNSKNQTPVDLFQKYHPELMQEFMDAIKLTPEVKASVIDGEMPMELGDDELSMQLDTSMQTITDPRIKLIGTVFGDKVSAALLKPEKRYKGLRWIMKNYSSAGLEIEGLKALLAAVALGLEEKVHKMNVIALDLLDSLILNTVKILSNIILEELGIINIVFAKAMSTTDRLLNRILDTLPRIAELPGVGAEYILNKTMSQLKGVTQLEKSQKAKRQKSLNVVILIILKLIDCFGTENWPHKEIEDLIVSEMDTHNTQYKENIQQLLTIIKDTKSEASSSKAKEDESPSKKPIIGEERIVLLQEEIEKLHENSESTEWEEKFRQLMEILAEKNLVNFMAGVDLCNIFINKALEENQKFLQEKLPELTSPILSKIATMNKRLKKKCKDFTLLLWKNSIESNSWIHRQFASYFVAPEQSKLSVGTMEVFQEILKHMEDKKICDQRKVEEGLGVDLKVVLKLVISELENKSQQVRKLSTEILVKITELISIQSDRNLRNKSIMALESLLRSIKSAVKDKLLEKFNKDIVAEIRRLDEENISPAKLASDEDKLIYAEPLSNELKTQLAPVLQYFSETIVQCLYSQNWASRASALNKVKEEISFGALETIPIPNMEQNVNIAMAPIVKATEPWVIMLKHIMNDPVLKIYIDGLDLVKELIVTFKKNITNQEDLTRINNTLTSGIIEKLGDQKPKIREKSIDFLLDLLKENLMIPGLISNMIISYFEKLKGSVSENQLCSILKICIECVSHYKVTQSNQKLLSDHIHLLNASLKHTLPGIRHLSEQLYVDLHAIHGDDINQYLVGQKAAVIKKLQSLCNSEETKVVASKSGKNFYAPTKTGGFSVPELNLLYEPGCEALLTSEDPAQRVKGLIAIKKNISKQQALKEMDSDKAHALLDEISMFMRTALNETNPNVYLETLKLLKFALNQLLKHLSPFDLQITVNSIITILMPKTISSPNYKIQISSDKFVVALGKDPLIGPVMIIKNIFRLLDKLAAEYTSYQKALRMSGSQTGFGNQMNSGFDIGQNIAAVIRYIGICNIMLTHYKTTIVNSKEAIEIFSCSAINMFTAYVDKCQIKEAIAQFSRDIRSVDPKAFEIILIKKDSEGREKLSEMLNATPGEFEEKHLAEKEGIWRKATTSKNGFLSARTNSENGSMLPKVHLSSKKEDVRGSKNLPSYSKRMSKNSDGVGNPNSQVLPPIGGSERPQVLPPLVLKKTQPLPNKKDVPNWLDEKPNNQEIEEHNDRRGMTTGSFVFH